MHDATDSSSGSAVPYDSSLPTMNRRQFVRTALTATATVGVAGCSGSGTNSGGAPDVDPDTADVEVAIGRNAPQNQSPYEDSVGNVVPRESEELSMSDVIFQRAGERGIVVAGDATNTGDRVLRPLNAEVVLYNRDEEGHGVRDATSTQAERDRLGAGDTWQWAVTFGSDPSFPIDYFTVQIVANFA
ncbi:FxLYD domain-containing protein [Salinarchaeum laminariae]|uniref:FxLYD domain-containing protein n=1 Tax=Salinarchaeum laminariae TaxID=869888 RepID=UPI0020BFB7F7|nr:FxLYD domain-containing protein [Salinarchaeum laminariae]